LRQFLGGLRWRMANLSGSSADSEIGRRLAVEFDAEFYRVRNPDVAASGIDPLAHFLDYGWREGRDPRPDFSLADYRELNPDLDGDTNPFAHYVLSGREQGRAGKRELGFRHDLIVLRAPMAARLAAAEGEPVLGQPAELLAQALGASRSGLADLHLSVSHDNYLEHLGGVQLCVLREARGLEAQGVDHLHLFPAWNSPMVRPGRDAGAVGVVWNGRSLGYFEPAAIAQTLARVLSGIAPTNHSFALHNLLGHSTGDILAILQAVGLKDGFFWIHDFASLCAGFHLMRNDVADCGAPPPDSAACAVCLYGPYRQGHIDEHRRLFEALSLTVVAPSDGALELWRSASDFPHAGEIVIPHARLEPSRSGDAQPAGGPLRVAFVGVGAPHKGWPVFHDLVARFRVDPRYEFVHLGRKAPQVLPIEFHEVTVTADQPQAMRDALQDLAIDVAVVWPLCRETFSFTAYEAAAAGVAVLTHPDSGNVAAFVARGGYGRVLADETELTAMFEGGEVLDLSRVARRPLLHDLSFGALTADLRPRRAVGRAS
jgi:hypothetical protein